MNYYIMHSHNSETCSQAFASLKEAYDSARNYKVKEVRK